MSEHQFRRCPSCKRLRKTNAKTCQACRVKLLDVDPAPLPAVIRKPA